MFWPIAAAILMAESSVCWDKQLFDAANSDDIVFLIETV
ncbi:hypothetical protein L901_03350 [Agrobacterium sp. D14]|nr:hypothetical protein L901_03350 [Agrobacterium sp. D14]